MSGTFEIAFLDPGVEVYAFTFGQLDMVDDLVPTSLRRQSAVARNFANLLRQSPRASL